MTVQNKKRLGLILGSGIILLMLMQYVHFHIGSADLYAPYANNILISIPVTEDYTPQEKDVLIFVPEYSNALVNEPILGIVYLADDNIILRTKSSGEIATAQMPNIHRKVIWPWISNQRYQQIKAYPLTDSVIGQQTTVRYYDENHKIEFRAPLDVSVSGDFSRGSLTIHDKNNLFEVKSSNTPLVKMYVVVENLNQDKFIKYVNEQSIEYWSYTLNDINGYLATAQQNNKTLNSFLFIKNGNMYDLIWYEYDDEQLTTTSQQIVDTVSFLD